MRQADFCPFDLLMTCPYNRQCREENQSTTLRDPKVYLNIKFGIPTSNYIGDMLWTRIRLGWMEGQTDAQTVQKLYAHKADFGDIINIIIITQCAFMLVFAFIWSYMVV